MRFALLTTFVVASLLPIAAGAQSLGELGSMVGGAFTLSVSPQFLAPYSQASISPVSSTLNLANATLTVSVGGKEIYKGSVRPVSVSLGGAGSVATVKVTVSSGGTDYSQTLSLVSQDVVLIAEPIASAPPLYPGKPSVPHEGDVRIVAVANLRDAKGKTSSPATYSYEWSVDDARIAYSSGIGKSSIIVASPLQYRTREVSVIVKNSSGSLVGGSSLSLTALDPSVRIYENDPLLGIRYDRALSGSYTIDDAEATLYAAPFSLPTTSGAPVVQWFLGGSPVQTGTSITLRPTGSGRGDASLSLTASGGGPVPALASLSLIFGATSGFNFFGL